MSRLLSIALSSALIGGGTLAWALAARPLITNPDLAAPLNPLGINRSPYGEVLAMAMQGPIDTYFDAGMASSPHQSDDEPAAATAKLSWGTRFENLLSSLDRASEQRTNPRAASDALKRHLRRQAEDKLRFAYQLDPSHYGNYNALHFFLTEPEVGTRPELSPSAAKLADETIQYCLKQDQDPRPALTAAAAASNVLELMLNDQHNPKPKYDTTQMRSYLNLLDHCLARYRVISQQWDQSKHWDLLSPQRIIECSERLHFNSKIRDAADQTILRIEQKNLAPQSSIQPSAPQI
jgi:hypothetical protein